MSSKTTKVVINGSEILMNGDVHVVGLINGKLHINGAPVSPEYTGQQLIVKIEGDIHGDLEVKNGSVTCGNVVGSVDAGGSVTCQGSVSGFVDAGGSVKCGDVGRDVSAGGSVSCVGRSPVESPQVGQFAVDKGQS